MGDEELDRKADKLNFSIELSLRYHQRRRAFCEWAHNGIMFLILILGSAAFSELVQGWHHYFVFLATSLAAFDLVWKPSHRSRDHEMLFRRFTDLAVAVRTTPASDEQYAQWKRTRLLIEADEPPVYWALARDCHNEVMCMTATPRKVIEIGRWQRLTMNLFRHANAHFQESKSSA